MKVLMLARPNLLSYPGGDTTQILNTAQEIEKMGIQCEINPSKIDYALYDIVHFFNIIDPEDIIGHLKHLQCPFVLSTIYCIYDEYDRSHRSKLASLAYKIFSRNGIEYLKTMAKWAIKGEPLSTYEFIWLGHKRSIQKILKNAACLLPNSESEYRRLYNDMKIERPYLVVPNGVNLDFFTPKESYSRKTVLCVGRIEGCKNQLNLIKALSGLEIQVYIVGQPAKNQLDYFQKCKAAAGSNIHFTGFVPQQELIDYYLQAKVHALPSWFETTGLSSLEAARMGCNTVVADKGDVKDYFGDDTFYCDPENPDSIRNAVLKAYNAPYNEKLAKRIEQEYNWQNAAKKTIEGYHFALKNCRLQ